MLNVTLRWLLRALEVLLSCGAFFGSVQLLRDPSGRLLDMPAERFLSADSLFHDWAIPGAVLFVANGVWPLVVVGASLAKARWARLGHVAVGLVLLGWMVVELLVVGLTAGIQFVYLGYALVLLALALAAAWLEREAPHSGGHRHERQRRFARLERNAVHLSK